MSGLLISLAILAVIVGGAAYIFLSRKKAVADALAVPAYSEWSISHPAGQTVSKMIKGADGLFYFDFPQAPGSNNYVTTVAPQSPPKVQVGQTVKLRFVISGNGKIMPTEANTGPARLRLLLWRQGDDLSGLAGTTEFYRLWSHDVQIPGAGEYELSEKLDAALWTGVWGKTAPATNFADTVNNLALIGFSLGSSSAGHGCYIADGNARFTLREYSVT